MEQLKRTGHEHEYSLFPPSTYQIVCQLKEGSQFFREVQVAFYIYTTPPAVHGSGANANEKGEFVLSSKKEVLVKEKHLPQHTFFGKAYVNLQAASVERTGLQTLRTPI